MGVLVDGVWTQDDSKFKLDPSKQAEVFATPQDQIEIEGGERYFLYVSHGCPFAARPWTVASFLGLTEGKIRVVIVAPANDLDGWFFTPVSDGEKKLVADVEAMGEHIQWDSREPWFGATHLHQVYSRCNPRCSGRVSTPLLVDTKTGKGISSESMDITRIFLECFTPLHAPGGRLDTRLDSEVLELSKFVHADINSKVYGRRPLRADAGPLQHPLCRIL